ASRGLCPAPGTLTPAMRLQSPLLLTRRHPPSPWIYTLSLHDALPIFDDQQLVPDPDPGVRRRTARHDIVNHDVPEIRALSGEPRSEEHTSELQSRGHLVCRLLLEKKKMTRSSRAFDKLQYKRCGKYYG